MSGKVEEWRSEGVGNHEKHETHEMGCGERMAVER